MNRHDCNFSWSQGSLKLEFGMKTGDGLMSSLPSAYILTNSNNRSIFFCYYFCGLKVYVSLYCQMVGIIKCNSLNSKSPKGFPLKYCQIQWEWDVATFYAYCTGYLHCILHKDENRRYILTFQEWREKQSLGLQYFQNYVGANKQSNPIWLGNYWELNINLDPLSSQF